MRAPPPSPLIWGLTEFIPQIHMYHRLESSLSQHSFGIQWWKELTKLAPNSFNYIIPRFQKWIRLLCNHTIFINRIKFQTAYFQSTSKFIHRIGNISQHYSFLCFPPRLLDVHVNVHDLHTLSLKPAQWMSISHPSDERAHITR